MTSAFLTFSLAAYVVLRLDSFPAALAETGEAPASTAVEVAPGDFPPGVIARSDQQNTDQISNSGLIVGREGGAAVDAGVSVTLGKRFLAEIRAKTRFAGALCHFYAWPP